MMSGSSLPAPAENPMMSGASAAEGLTGGISAAGYTQCQEEVLNGIGYGFFMGKMAAFAIQGINITGYNTEVDRFNAWIQQKYGNDPSLLMQKLPETYTGMAGSPETAAGMTGSISVTPNN